MLRLNNSIRRPEKKMATNTVSLDALIPRDDLAAESEKVGGQPRGTIAITDLDSGFFANSLRKPDFQRETSHWSPQKVVDLVEAFLDGDLIPAVILWQRGSEIFVIDGAHRLSALIAWIKDDYGDKLTSLNFFGGRITPEQEKIADKTRKLIKKTIGSYDQYQAAKSNPDSTEEKTQHRLGQLASGSLTVQWVSASDSSRLTRRRNLLTQPNAVFCSRDVRLTPSLPVVSCGVELDINTGLASLKTRSDRSRF